MGGTEGPQGLQPTARRSMTGVQACVGSIQEKAWRCSAPGLHRASGTPPVGAACFSRTLVKKVIGFPGV